MYNLYATINAPSYDLLEINLLCSHRGDFL